MLVKSERKQNARQNVAFFELFHVNSLFSEWTVLIALFGYVPKDNSKMGCRTSAYCSRRVYTEVFTVGCN